MSFELSEWWRCPECDMVIRYTLCPHCHISKQKVREAWKQYKKSLSSLCDYERKQQNVFEKMLGLEEISR